MFAVFQSGGKQFVVNEGDVLSVEKVNAEPGQVVLFDRVLLIDAGGLRFDGDYHEMTASGDPFIRTFLLRKDSHDDA
jgi:ribosomal protein L21